VSTPLHVAITGHRGYLGAHLVARCRARGFRVLGLDTGLYDVPGTPPRVAADAESRRDVRDVVAADLAGAEVVIHAAALSSDALGQAFPGAIRDVNVAGTARVADAAREAGVRRLLVVSTAGLYAPGPDPCDEASPVAGVTAYRASKADAEAEALARASDAFRVQVLRLPTLYGDSPALRLDLVVNVLVHRACRGQALTLHGDGSQWRPLGHVRDLADLLARAAGASFDAPAPAVCNACTDAMNHRVADVVARVAAAFPGLAVEAHPAPPGGGESWRVGSHRLSAWMPDAAFPTGLDDAIAELRARFAACPPAGAPLEAAWRAPFLAAATASGRLGADLRTVPLASPGGFV
jgi:nucleoside-diphosphate-sugar epimerase